MVNLGVFLVVLAALVAALAAIRHDPRFTRREVWIQVSLIALVVTVSSGLATFAFRAAALRKPPQPAAAAAAVLAGVWILGGLFLLARYLRSRLRRRE